MIKKLINDIKVAAEAEERGHYCWAAILYRRLKMNEEAEMCESLAQWIAGMEEGKGF